MILKTNMNRKAKVAYEAIQKEKAKVRIEGVKDIKEAILVPCNHVKWSREVLVLETNHITTPAKSIMPKLAAA
jgi:hypothetical protein